MDTDLATVKKFFEDYAEYLKHYQKDEPMKSTCKASLYVDWQCCDTHKALAIEDDQLQKTADSLNDSLDLGGIPSSFMSVANDDYPRDAPQVRSPKWMNLLSEKSGVELPEEIASWIERIYR